MIQDYYGQWERDILKTLRRGEFDVNFDKSSFDQTDLRLTSTIILKTVIVSL